MYIQNLAFAVFLLTLGIAAGFYYHSRIRALSVFAEEHLDKPVDTSEETDVQPHQLASSSVVGAAPERTHDEKLFEFAEMIHGLAELTTDLLEKKRTSSGENHQSDIGY